MRDETLSLRISEVESRALKKRAREEGISRGNLVRRALRAYGITPEPEPAKTAYDVAKHIAGKYRGKSKDLSTNPRHLTDYGK